MNVDGGEKINSRKCSECSCIRVPHSIAMLAVLDEKRNSDITVNSCFRLNIYKSCLVELTEWPNENQVCGGGGRRCSEIRLLPIYNR